MRVRGMDEQSSHFCSGLIKFQKLANILKALRCPVLMLLLCRSEQGPGVLGHEDGASPAVYRSEPNPFGEGVSSCRGEHFGRRVRGREGADGCGWPKRSIMTI